MTMSTPVTGVVRQYAAAMAAGLSMFILGNWVSWPSPAVKHILAGDTKLDISPVQVSWAVALLDLGNIISPIPSSYVTNYLGRKVTLIILSFVFFLTWLLAIFGTTAYYLYTARFLVGLSKGLTYIVVPIYLGEIASTQVRGGVGTIFGGMMAYGMLFELLIGSFVDYDTLNIISSPFPVLFFLFFFRFPETPYFLLMKGREDEAKKSLAYFRSSKEDSTILQQELKQISKNVSEDSKKTGGYMDLVSSPSTRRATLISVGLATIQRLSGCTSIIAYSTVTLPPTGGYFSPDVYMIIFAVVMIIGLTICTTLIDMFGRKPLLIISSVGCMIGTGVTAVFYWMSTFTDVTAYNWVPYFGIIFYSIMLSIGLGNIPPVITVELFPANLRSHANALTAVFYALSSFITNKMYLQVKMSIGVHYMYLFFMICSFIGVIFTSFVVFETKGMTFSEIQDTLKKKTHCESENIPVAANMQTLKTSYGI
ncbi:facilitated trehalose transporter Tret1-like [Macrosteles quadrilineatus]|uniref:facilitated trehalose transporter Tret1-like n=1 Tax=Macrosteles quadrilineatus TaxID=74068 RepID=UPI0023E1588E|nr:facilitated trehalose transporter Tret1-like [Macrosteles quadrilineatus]XP_054270511.1 facilitated trehalose transporter Tret1-like [Macrosteles quadrilineatus]